MGFSDVTSLGSAAACVVVVLLFLRYLRMQDRRNTEERKDERHRLMNFIVNDTAHVAEQLEKVSEGLKEILNVLKRMNGKK